MAKKASLYELAVTMAGATAVSALGGFLHGRLDVLRVRQKIATPVPGDQEVRPQDKSLTEHDRGVKLLMKTHLYV